ncbi:MAG: RDD family protein [Chloroflexi bacterium]|nr:RDD family protein [Chloroflexota bacterium]
MGKASSFKRLIAYLLDSLILGLLNSPFILIFGLPAMSDVLNILSQGDVSTIQLRALNDFMRGPSAILTSVSLILGIGYYLYFWTARNGQTPGKWLMKIRVVTTDGSPITRGKALLRFVGYSVDIYACLLGFFWILIDKDRQGWHDKIAGTYVVNA